MTDIKLVIFDIAGTTVKDNGEVVAAFVAALRQHKIEFQTEQLKSLRGSSKREAVFKLIPEGADREQRAPEVYSSFREQLIERYRKEGVEAIKGAAEVFQKLRAHGISTALNTGFDQDITQLLLCALGWQNGIVDAVICGDDVLVGRPAPYLIFHAMEATRTISARVVANVGDTVNDLEAAHNAGVNWNVGVLSGANDREQLERAPHTHLIESIAELPSLLEI